jgi:hypothetical protein
MSRSISETQAGTPSLFKENMSDPEPIKEDIPSLEERVSVEEQLDGNIFGVMGSCIRALKRAGKPEWAKRLQERVFKAGNYDQALAICQEYCSFDSE